MADPGSRGADRVGRTYWDRLWADDALPDPVDPSNLRAGNYLNRRLGAYFDRFLRELPEGSQLLEVGCARSAWLPYFAHAYRFHVSGLDYSPHGCETAREILRRAGADAEVYCADLFDPPTGLRGRYDVVVSLGVVEHFDGTAVPLRALRELLTPEGRILTVVPNLTGLLGRIERRINREVYEMHVPLSPRLLAAAHADAGLRVDHAGHFMAVNFGVLNLNGLPDRRRTRALAVVLRQLRRVSTAIWMLEDYTHPLPTSRMFSPYVVCSARNHT